MDKAIKMTNGSRAWLSKFQLMNLELRRTLNGRYLYSYQVTHSEYKELEQMLINNRTEAFSALYNVYWAACFCLYVAETYRREYGAQEDGWSWQLIWSRLGYAFSPLEYQKIVERGLKHWQRPIRQDARGRNLLGSLFMEGGLPWNLVKNDSHGFGVLVKRGLSNYYVARDIGQSLLGLIADSENSLPLTFRSQETHQLIAGIIEQLIYLAENFDLKNKKDPAGFLDVHEPSWRSKFPIPLDEENGKNLINEWLIKAEEQHQRHQRERVVIKEIYCVHELIDEVLTNANYHQIVTTVYLPEKLEIEISNINQLASTRFELVFYEGDRLLKKGGFVYGEIINNRVILNPTTHIFKLHRHSLSDAIQIRFLENGYEHYRESISKSDLDQQQFPLVFELCDQGWIFVNNASCKLVGNSARLSLPSTCRVIEGSEQLLNIQNDGVRWVEINETILLKDSTETYSILLRQDSPQLKLRLGGVLSLHSTNPSKVFMGLPNLIGEEEICRDLIVEVNGHHIDNLRHKRNSMVGSVKYCVKNVQGETVLKQNFSVLPAGLTIRQFSATQNGDARIVVSQLGNVPISILESNILWQKNEINNNIELALKPKFGEEPTHLTLCIGNQNDPIQIYLPYPREGALLVDSNKNKVTNRDFTIDDLLGLRLILTSNQIIKNSTSIAFRLGGTQKRKLERTYRIPNYSNSISLSLLSYQHDILQMLSTVDEQDAYVQLSVDSGVQLIQINIRRYQSIIDRNDSFSFNLKRINGSRISETAELLAMRLADPKQHSIQLPEKQSQGVGIGEYDIPSELERDGPWLIYPSNESKFKFRPHLHLSQHAELETKSVSEITSLHHATARFHPKNAPDVISSQIQLMTEDLSHSGWQYIIDLKSQYPHLILSTFETWKALAKQPQALVFALFRIDPDAEFCERIETELAVLWETIPVDLWVKAFVVYRKWLLDQALPESLVDGVMQNRLKLLVNVMAGFTHLSEYVKTQDIKSLSKMPIEFVLQDWYQQLRRQHHNTEWPIQLGVELSAWIAQQKLPESIKELSQIDYTHAVTYLPIFMAYVSVGLASINDLRKTTTSLKFEIKVLADFDRNVWYTPVHSMMVSYLLATK